MPFYKRIYSPGEPQFIAAHPGRRMKERVFEGKAADSLENESLMRYQLRATCSSRIWLAGMRAEAARTNLIAPSRAEKTRTTEAVVHATCSFHSCKSRRTVVM
jgi:hypothetical protein